MTDRETTLSEIWRKERPMYEAWGAYVCKYLTTAINEHIEPGAIDLFFRIPLKHRTKEEASLLAKAFHRAKPYKDPYNEIEDKVGVRIVVLFSKEIRIVENVILSSDLWKAEKSRDFEEERKLRPFEFDYQSLHYIIRNKEALSFDGQEIHAGLACEIQVRTILQHAYSELTHDTIYKPSIQAEPDMKRAAAKSMALIEATDDYFSLVREKLELAQAPSLLIQKILDQQYRNLTEMAPDISPLNTLLIDHYKSFAKENFEEEITKFLHEKKFISDIIAERAPTELLYRQPSILLLYWAISQSRREAALNSPLSKAELEPIYSDLGSRLD